MIAASGEDYPGCAAPGMAQRMDSVNNKRIVETPETDADATAAVLSRTMHRAARAYLTRVALPEMGVTQGKTRTAKN